MKTLKLTIIVVLIALAAAVAFAYSGIYNVSADSGHTRIVDWYLNTLRERSVAVRADRVEVPRDLDEDRRIEAGAGHFKDMCAGCHGFPGRDPNQSFGPTPPALYRQQIPADQAFWVVKHGIKMSAMPGHRDHSDEENWDTVAFVRALPQMSPDEYETITADAEHAHADGQHHEPPGDNGDDDQHHGGHEHDQPETAEDTLDAFHHALAEGDGRQAKAYMHRHATVLEGGKLETTDGYAASHMQHDMEFLQEMDIEMLARERNMDDSQATFVTQRRMSGHPGDRELDLLSTEIATLVQSELGWRIAHLSWTSRPYGDMPPDSH